MIAGLISPVARALGLLLAIGFPAALPAMTKTGTAPANKASTVRPPATSSKAASVKPPAVKPTTTTKASTTTNKTHVTAKHTKTGMVIKTPPGVKSASRWVVTYRDNVGAVAQQLTLPSQAAAERWLEGYKKKHPQGVGILTRE